LYTTLSDNMNNFLDCYHDFETTLMTISSFIFSALIIPTIPCVLKRIQN
jgi:hypothetical protein